MCVTSPPPFVFPLLPRPPRPGAMLRRPSWEGAGEEARGLRSTKGSGPALKFRGKSNKAIFCMDKPVTEEAALACLCNAENKGILAGVSWLCSAGSPGRCLAPSLPPAPPALKHWCLCCSVAAGLWRLAFLPFAVFPLLPRAGLCKKLSQSAAFQTFLPVRPAE